MLTKQKNSRRQSVLLPLSAVVLVLAAQGCATEDKKATKVQPPAATTPVVPKSAPQAENVVPPPAPIVEQAALDRLKQMSEQLAATKSFTYRQHNFVEMRADTGQFLTLFTVGDVALQRPDKLHINVWGDVPSFQVYFNGDKVSTVDPEKKVHCVSKQSLSTIDEMLDFVINNAKINFPSADFMYSDPYTMMTQNLTNAIVVGETMVNGVLCDHFAYMAPAVNWEIWIEKGKNALPLRLAMTYTQAANFPRFLVEYTNWNLKPKLKASTFTFTPSADFEETEFFTIQSEQKTR